MASPDSPPHHLPPDCIDVPAEGRVVDGVHLLASAARQPRVDVFQSIEYFGADQPLDHYIARDPYPIPDPPDRGDYHGQRHFAYWVSGLCDFLRITREIAAHGFQLRPGDSVLDFGCHSGRTLRHFACQLDGLDLHGVDVQVPRVDWCRRFLPRRINIMQGRHEPPLTLPDNALSLVYALSVFTHIDRHELAWLAELRRILRPGGVAVISIHSERLWTRMNRKHPIYNGLMKLKDHPKYPVDPDQFSRPMHSERVVFRMNDGPMHLNVFHSDAYIRREWGRFFHVADIVETERMVQADVILIKQ